MLYENISIYEKIDKLIAESMTLASNMKKTFGEDSARYRDAVLNRNLWREIKTELVKATKGDEENPGVDLSIKANEIAILTNMYKSRLKAIKEFEKAGDDPLAQENLAICRYEANALAMFIPKPTDPEDVKKETMCVLKTFVELKSIEDPKFNVKSIQRYTKDIISKVKEKYPDAENAIIAGCIQAYAKS